MKINKIINQLVIFAKDSTKVEIVPFYTAPQDYKGYILVCDNVQIQTNKSNQYIVKGYIFKQQDIAENEEEEEEDFNFLGETFSKDDDFISFNSKDVQVLDMQNNVELGFGLSTPFEAKISIQEEDDAIGNIAKVEININNEKIIEVEGES